MDMDDAKVFKILDLEDIEKTFSAYQRQQVEALRCSRLILELMRHEIYQQSCFDFPFLILIRSFLPSCFDKCMSDLLTQPALSAPVATVCN